MTDIAYPNVHVQLSGEDGNAFSILARTSMAVRAHLRNEGHDSNEIDTIVQSYTDEATSADYDHLIQTTMRWVNVS